MNAGTTPRDPDACWTCNQKGHRSWNCPHQNQQARVTEITPNYMDAMENESPMPFYQPLSPDNKLDRLREEIEKLSIEEFKQLSSGGTEQQDFPVA